MIQAAQVFENAVGPLHHLITGAIHSASRLPEGVGEKSFRRQLRATEVAPGQTDTGQIEFTGNTAGYWVEIGVQHMQLDVADRRTDGHGVTRFRAASPVAHIDGRFRGAIQVVQLHIIPCRKDRLLQLAIQRLAAADQSLQMRQVLQAGATHEGVEHGGHKVQRCDAFILHHLLQPHRIRMGLRRGHSKSRPHHQWPEKFPHGHIETERRLL